MLSLVIVSALGTLVSYLLWHYANGRLENPGMLSAGSTDQLEHLRMGARIAGVYILLPLFLLTVLAEAGPLIVLYLIALLLAGYWLAGR